MSVQCLITDNITTLEIHKGYLYVTQFLHYPKRKQNDNKHITDVQIVLFRMPQE